VEKPYVFDGPAGKVTLADLFDGRSQLFIKHFMMGPGQTDSASDARSRSTTSRAFSHTSRTMTCRMPSWRARRWRKSRPSARVWAGASPGFRPNRSDFNYDFNVSFRPEDVAAGRAYYNYRYTNPGLEDLSGDSVFFRNDAGEIFHTYSVYGRGGEEFLGAYRYLDVMPKGRDENGPYRTLADWVRPKNMYGKGGMVEANGRYHVPSCACATHR